MIGAILSMMHSENEYIDKICKNDNNFKGDVCRNIKGQLIMQTYDFPKKIYTLTITYKHNIKSMYFYNYSELQEYLKKQNDIESVEIKEEYII